MLTTPLFALKIKFVLKIGELNQILYHKTNRNVECFSPLFECSSSFLSALQQNWAQPRLCICQIVFVDFFPFLFQLGVFERIQILFILSLSCARERNLWSKPRYIFTISPVPPIRTLSSTFRMQARLFKSPILYWMAFNWLSGRCETSKVLL